MNMEFIITVGGITAQHFTYCGRKIEFDKNGMTTNCGSYNLLNNAYNKTKSIDRFLMKNKDSIQLKLDGNAITKEDSVCSLLWSVQKFCKKCNEI